MNPRISMITLGVRDLEAARQFYEDGLGLPRKPSPPEVVFLTLNGTWLGLFSRTDLAKDAGVKPQGTGFSGITLSHNVATEAEVQQVMEIALAAGATQVKVPARADWGGFHGYFSDLDGYLWEVAYNPFSWIGPEDD